MQTTTHQSPAAHLLALAIALALATPAAASSNAVTQWNATTASPVVASRFGAPPQQARAIAIVQVAVHDALNAISPRYASYNTIAPAPGANPEAAVAAASHRALHRLIDPMPASQAKIDALLAIDTAYANALAGIPDGAAKAAGLVVGAAAADAIADRRSNDGSATPHLPYAQPVVVGIHQPTPVLNSNPQAFVAPAFAGWGAMQPFVVHSSSQFRMDPGDLFDIGSATYTREYDEVKQVGDALVRGALPSSEESDVARFWPGGGANWNRAIREILAAPSLNPHLDLALDLWEQARLFALANMAESDAAITVFETKYAYNFWRPVTAIRWIDDGNPATAPNPSWWPFLATPPYPDYTCGLTTTAGANIEVLRRYFRTDEIAYGFTINAAPVPLPAPLLPLPAKPITRVFVSLADAGRDSVDARVYAGIHFREGCTKGITQGEQVGRFVFQHALRPLKKHALRALKK